MQRSDINTNDYMKRLCIYMNKKISSIKYLKSYHQTNDKEFVSS